MLGFRFRRLLLEDIYHSRPLSVLVDRALSVMHSTVVVTRQPLFYGHLLDGVVVSMFAISRRQFSSAKKKEKMKAFKLKQEQYRKENMAAQEAPDFATMIRQLYRKSHPDLLRHSHPEYAEVNDQSMQVLNGILTTIKTNEYPPRIVKDITFYMKVTSDGEYKPFLLSVRTGGGDCKGCLTDAFGSFFIATGLSPDGKFVWNKEYFPLELDTTYHSNFQI